MADSKGKSNAQSLFGRHQIPSDNQIRNRLDGVAPKQVFPVFEEILQVLDKQGELEGFCSVSETLLVAMDGTEYISSTQLCCPQCSTRTLRSGNTQYFHSVVTPVIVCPGQSQVIPLVPEFVQPQDGHDKQDCENAAAKRWLAQHGERFSRPDGRVTYHNAFVTRYTITDDTVVEIVQAGRTRWKPEVQTVRICGP